LKQTLDTPKWVETCEDSTCDSDFYKHVSEVENTFGKCAAFLATHPGIDACVSRLKNFTPTWLRQHDNNSYGFNWNNENYLEIKKIRNRP